MRRIHRWTVLVLILNAALLLVPVAYAHPLGNFTINHYAGLHASQEIVAIDYVLDMAEIPAFQEISALDTNKNGLPDPGEITAYPDTQCQNIQSGLSLKLAGRAVHIGLTSSVVEFPPGQGGLLTLRLTCTFQSPVPVPGKSYTVDFTDESYSERLGWREIVVGGEGVSVEGSIVSTSLSNRLTSYPQDLLSNPPDQRRVSFEVAPVIEIGTVQSRHSLLGPVELPQNSNDAFTRLILLENITFPTLLAALALSFVWGAMHALTPGHGKTIVGAYLVGAHGTVQHALWLGLTTTITHTAGVFGLGVVTLFAARYMLPEQLFPWLGLLSGLLVVSIGVSLFINRLRRVWAGNTPGTNPAADHHRSHPGHVEDHHHPPHEHDHYHDHGHQGGHVHPHLQSHSHHGHAHSHLPPGADGSPVTWRSLLALGISGGLIPCPSALVVLLSAIALNRIGLGLLLVLAFSLGLAGVLTGIGLVFVYAGRFFERTSGPRFAQSRLVQSLPVFSALFIAFAGLGIAIKALIDMGIISL